jgi:Predicted nucleic acid-binding protein, contains PIN domain
LPKVVSNSSPLIHLARIGQLNLLKHFFNEIIVPEAVHKECVIEGKDREDAKKIEKVDWIKVAKIRDENLKKALMMVLDEGEAEAITLALEESA